ncbi:insulinase (Peptidase family M16) protein [Artemisia annua]|uniref:Insulinase (Peptidase family M16) protein n=1 Tax=Artemisia annua TaxID=35608 RepID=A0A2U1M344_ARTAN|nr:insulinase (Peptidase family M16) protein [Artemisia annua]
MENADARVWVIFDHLHATAFQYTPLGKTILGPAENIEKITKKDIQDYISTHYAAHRMVISASGAVKHEELVEQVKKTFTKLSANPLTTSQIVEKEPAMFTGSELKSSLLLHVDGTSATADDIGRQLLTYGRRIPYAELFARIDAVDAATIKRVANRFIFDQDLAIVASGPVKLLPDYNWFRRRTYKLRY